MAVNLSDDYKLYATFPIVKTEETDEGLVVYGKASDGSLDADDQVVDPVWSGAALSRWLHSGGNVRVQHNPQLYPAGKGLSVEVDRDGDGGHWVKSLIVEPTAQKLVRHGVLRAYSIGISRPVIRRDVTGKARGGIVTGDDNTEVAELSLVDRPANRSCAISLVKSEGDTSPWSYGDLEKLLAAAETDLTKADATELDGPDDEPDSDDVGDATPDAPDEDDGDEPPTARKSYNRERAAWLAREPRPDYGDTPANGTAFLVKQAAVATARKAWATWSDEGEQYGYTDPDTGYARWVAKRDMDPDVGGGVDRDKIPAGDFVDPKRRRFPIVTPGDVSDAVHSFGRADPPIPLDKFRHRLTAIAHRLGPEFVAELPQSWGDKDDVATVDVAKNITLTLPDPDGLVPYNLAGGAVKAAKKCPKCGAEHHADSKLRRCEGCGAKLPKADKVKRETNVTIKGHKKPLPADVEPAGVHREPDGDAVESLEHDAGMHTDPDPVRDDTPESVKADDEGKPFPGAAPPFGSKSATPYQVKRMHDALCAAYPWSTVTGTYPSLGTVADAIVPGWFGEQVTAAANKGDMARVVALAGSATEADLIAKGGIDPAVLADGRAEVHKAFTDAYPDVTVHPSHITPGQFQRPYISAGHAPLSAGMSATQPNVPPSTRVPDPNDFDRPLITAGHEADSPSNRGGNNPTGSVATGSARTLYASASKAAARTAMQAMHDHIAATSPDMCPMAPSRAVMPPSNGATNVPTPVTAMPETYRAPGEISETIGLTPKAVRKLIKSAVATATKAVRDEYEDTINDLRQEVDKLGAQPDPAQAPLRGVVRKADTGGTDLAPVERISLVEQAQAAAAQQQQEEVAFAAKFLNHPDPAKRAVAEQYVRKVLTPQS